MQWACQLFPVTSFTRRWTDSEQFIRAWMNSINHKREKVFPKMGPADATNATARLLVAQCFDWIELGRFVGGEKPEDDADESADGKPN